MLMTFRGKTPQVSPEAFVADSAALIGDVTVGADSSIWFGAVLRGDNEPITVGHGAIVHCTSVGSNTLIGMGAIVLDGAVVGAHCIIGAGAVVKENAVVPDGTMMVGIPARPVRTLGEEQIAFLNGQSPYVALSKEYMK